jgi:hypothetical protein
MTSSGLTQCLVIFPKCWHNTHKACLNILHHLVGLDTCDHTIITRVVPVQLVQLQNHLHPWTAVIKTEFSDQLEISVPMNWHSVKVITQFLRSSS